MGLIEIDLDEVRINPDKFKKNLKVSYGFIRENADLVRALWRIRDPSFSPYLIMQQSLHDVVMKKVASHAPVNLTNRELFSNTFAASAMANIKYYLDHQCTELDAIIDSIDASIHHGSITILYPEK